MGTVAIWRERAVDAARATALESVMSSPILARVLASRGVTVENLDAFRDSSLVRLTRSEDVPGVTEAVQVILPFLRENRKIVVFGDYDVDGVCASAILVMTLRRLGGTNVDAFIPRRKDEGYGMTEASLARLLEEHSDVALVVTVDNGISSPDEIAALRARGIAVVVTDHHIAGDRLPDADALVNTRIRSCPGCENLCGAGVAFFLAAALSIAARREKLYSGPKFGAPLLVLAGLATVADLMPLSDQNRILVSQSLALFREHAPLGLHELYHRAARTASDVASRDYGFMLSPRINAAGRMNDARKAYDLLMTQNREEARLLACEIDGFNGNRRSLEASMFKAACGQVDATDGLEAVVVRGEEGGTADAPGWHPGIAGIVASRLLEKYHVPVAVAVGCTGSVRAPEGYNVHAALSEVSEHLVRFGGHALAGGFTVRDGSFDAFKSAFSLACARQKMLTQAPQAAVIEFDGWIDPADLMAEAGLFNALDSVLKPYGEGNPEPVFGLRAVGLKDVDVMGAGGHHLSMRFVNQCIPRGVWWGQGARAETLRARAAIPHDILFTLTMSSFGLEQDHLELRIVDVRPARG